jgi:hypothetical protein
MCPAISPSFSQKNATMAWFSIAYSDRRYSISIDAEKAK